MALVMAAAGCGGPDVTGSIAASTGAPTDDPSATRADAPAGWPRVTSTELGHTPGSFRPLGVGALDRFPSDVAPPGPPPATHPSTVARILPSFTGGTFDRTRGTDLDDAIAALPEERRALGVAGVEGSVLFGAGTRAGVCEDPHVLLSVDGAEASLDVPWAFWLAGPLERDLAPLPDDCVAALLAAGTVDTGACDEADVRAHFPEGSACNTCLTVDGDHARCVDEGECLPTATRQLLDEGEWYAALRVPALVCAPDHVEDVILLVADLAEDDPLPEMYDHGAVSGHCMHAWDDGAVDLFCTLGEYSAVGDALPSRVDYIREDGAATTWAGRASLVAGVEVEGHTFNLSWLSQVGGTGVSAPNGSVEDAWGINPRALRPGGTDPEDPEHTFARDYVAAFVMKLSSWRDGVPVAFVNHNRCSEDAWEGPFADGTYACDEPGAWSAEWSDDAMIGWWNQPAGEIYTFPLVTLASTGLPDPSVPGGLLPEVLGSTTLADEEWEACTWPRTFVPDRVRLYDPAPGTAREGYASFDGQTYRLGRDPDVDVRAFLATSQTRGFCPP